jgi:hypothetical protein
LIFGAARGGFGSICWNPARMLFDIPFSHPTAHVATAALGHQP